MYIQVGWRLDLACGSSKENILKKHMSSKVLVNIERYGEYENDDNNEALINLIRRKSNSRRQQHREAEECQEG